MKVSSFPLAVGPLVLCALLLAAPQSGQSQCCPPIITTQPTNQLTWLGSNVMFSVVVSSSTTPSFQWRLNGTNVVNGANINGAASSNLTILSAQYTNVGDYSVAITNSAGGVISSNATLTLIGPPQIIVQPTNKTVTETGNTSFSVGGAGTNLTYQWRFYATNNLPAETNSTYNLNNAQAWQSGNYSVLVANGYGAVTSTTASATVTLPIGVVACWGNTLSPASTVFPETRGGYVAHSAGYEHSMGLRTNGTVVVWGGNTYGQTNVPPGLTNIVAISAGFFHSLALRSDGSVVSWGYNDFGQSNVPPGLAKVRAIAAGAHHNLALREDGTIVAWGYNGSGETNVPAGLDDVVRIAAGDYHNLALRRNGNLVCWGSNSLGQTNMPPGLTGIMAIAGGGGFSLVLRTNGAVTAWGENSFGQTNVPSPAATTLVAAIAAGGYHSVALKENGTVVTWGRNNVGQTNTPSILTAGNATLNAIAAGDSHSLALKGTGAPVITCQPLDQITSAGSNANFAVLATGSGVLFYSWFLNGSNVLSGSNKKIFTRTNVQPADMGDCFVIVSNVSGMTTSAVANLFLNGTFSLDALGPTNFPGGGGFVVRLNGIPGNYIIQISSNLTNWTDAHTSTVPASGFVDWLDLNPLPVRRFYRARLP